jgi:zinc-binding alcohol dehydrogenase/oxidoreductase
MRAWYLDESPGQYQWGEVPDPQVGPGDVKVRVRATALNHMDLWLTTGLPKPPSFPHVPGNDVAGVVEEVGSEVADWAPGDEVVINTAIVPASALVRGDDSVLDPAMTLLGEGCWGGHAEYCVVPGHQLARRPTGRSWAEAASYPVCYTTAWRLFRRARIQKGDTVLVTGIGGGVATAALMLARHVGARVFVTSRDPAKRERALELGAEAAFPSDEPYPITADIVLDSIGPATWDFAFRTLRHGGRMCVCGGTSGPKVEVNLPRLFFKQIEIIGASCGSQTEFQHVTDLLSEGLPVVVDEILPLSEYPRALERLRTAEQLGKIVLEHPEP